jgi:hypothetical protein
MREWLGAAPAFTGRCHRSGSAAATLTGRPAVPAVAAMPAVAGALDAMGIFGLNLGAAFKAGRASGRALRSADHVSGARLGLDTLAFALGAIVDGR